MSVNRFGKSPLMNGQRSPLKQTIIWCFFADKTDQAVLLGVISVNKQHIIM